MAIELPITEFFEAFQAKLLMRKVSIGSCVARETTLSERPDWVQLHINIGNDPKKDAWELANAVADRAHGERISFARLILPRGIEAANRIEQNQISIRFLAAKDIFDDENDMRADVLFTTGETKP